jgi:hypothetical protein
LVDTNPQWQEKGKHRLAWEAASAKNARPQRNVDSTYAAPIQDDGDTKTQDQQLMSEVQQAPSLTPEQELQQHQAQLQTMQQERDKVVATYAAS